MKLYKITGVARSGDKKKMFAGSQSEAGKVRKSLNSDCDVPRENITTEEIEVAPNKAGILAALNEHC